MYRKIMEILNNEDGVGDVIVLTFTFIVMFFVLIFGMVMLHAFGCQVVAYDAAREAARAGATIHLSEEGIPDEYKIKTSAIEAMSSLANAENSEVIVAHGVDPASGVDVVQLNIKYKYPNQFQSVWKALDLTDTAAGREYYDIGAVAVFKKELKN